MGVVFADRTDAGRQLGRAVLAWLDRDVRTADAIVLGLPRGGVPVAAEVADVLQCPLDVIVVRKLGVPTQPELAMGAIGEGGAVVFDHDVIAAASVSPSDLAAVADRERAELDARVSALRRGRTRLDLHGRLAVIVDDGLATGSTARVACAVARRLGAVDVIVAVPVAPRQTVAALGTAADGVVCLLVPDPFVAVGAHYRNFAPPTDAAVARLLDVRRRSA
jgi:putative phosphoribosyl transferase